MKQAPTTVSLVEDYLAARRKMGHALESQGKQLLAFGRFADAAGHRGPVTVDLMIRWAKDARNATRLAWARRLGMLRPFTQYRRQFDAGTETPPDGFFGPSRRWLTPHIYQEQEVVALLEATDKLRPAGIHPLTYRTLFGLLAATGMRVSEARHLKPEDMDLDHNILTVRETKFRKSRLVPLHPSTVAALKRYADARQQRFGGRQLKAFFVSNQHGTPLNESTVQQTFQKLRSRLSWIARGGHARPRIHDLRHTFICHTLLRIYRKGQSIDKMIDALSTYVGHTKVSHTYWYLTATPELMAVAAQRFSAFAEGGAR
jgi:integrase